MRHLSIEVQINCGRNCRHSNSLELNNEKKKKKSLAIGNRFYKAIFCLMFTNLLLVLLSNVFYLRHGVASLSYYIAVYQNSLIYVWLLLFGWDKSGHTCTQLGKSERKSPFTVKQNLRFKILYS